MLKESNGGSLSIKWNLLAINIGPLRVIYEIHLYGISVAIWNDIFSQATGYKNKKNMFHYCFLRRQLATVIGIIYIMFKIQIQKTRIKSRL